MNLLNKIKLTSKSVLALLGVVVLGVSAVIYAVTDAGSQITNLASVDYFDDNGNGYTATSNPASTTLVPSSIDTARGVGASGVPRLTSSTPIVES